MDLIEDLVISIILFVLYGSTENLAYEIYLTANAMFYVSFWFCTT